MTDAFLVRTAITFCWLVVFMISQDEIGEKIESQFKGAFGIAVSLGASAITATAVLATAMVCTFVIGLL